MSRGFQAVQNELRKLLGILQTSNKVKELKTAMHSLITFLEQQNTAQIIDTMPEQTRSTGICWSSIITSLLTANSTKSGLKKEVFETLKAVMKSADLRGTKNLVYVQNNIFDFIADSLDSENVIAQNIEFVSYLSEICSHQEYASCWEQKTFAKTIKVLTKMIVTSCNDKTGKHSESEMRCLTTCLQTIIETYPFDFTNFSFEIINFLDSVFSYDLKMSQFSQSLFGVLLSYLKKWSVNSIKASLHIGEKILQTFIVKNWKSSDQKHKELFVQLFRYLVLYSSNHVDSIQTLCFTEIEKDASYQIPRRRELNTNALLDHLTFLFFETIAECALIHKRQEQTEVSSSPKRQKKDFNIEHLDVNEVIEKCIQSFKATGRICWIKLLFCCVRKSYKLEVNCSNVINTCNNAINEGLLSTEDETLWILNVILAIACLPNHSFNLITQAQWDHTLLNITKLLSITPTAVSQGGIIFDILTVLIAKGKFNNSTMKGTIFDMIFKSNVLLSPKLCTNSSMMFLIAFTKNHFWPSSRQSTSVFDDFSNNSAKETPQKQDYGHFSKEKNGITLTMKILNSILEAFSPRTQTIFQERRKPDISQRKNLNPLIASEAIYGLCFDTTSQEKRFDKQRSFHHNCPYNDFNFQLHLYSSKVLYQEVINHSNKSNQNTDIPLYFKPFNSIQDAVISDEKKWQEYKEFEELGRSFTLKTIQNQSYDKTEINSKEVDDYYSEPSIETKLEPAIKNSDLFDRLRSWIRERANELVRDGETIINSKKKTLGIDRERLSIQLQWMIKHIIIMISFCRKDLILEMPLKYLCEKVSELSPLVTSCSIDSRLVMSFLTELNRMANIFASFKTKEHSSLHKYTLNIIYKLTNPEESMNELDFDSDLSLSQDIDLTDERQKTSMISNKLSKAAGLVKCNTLSLEMLTDILLTCFSCDICTTKLKHISDNKIIIKSDKKQETNSTDAESDSPTEYSEVVEDEVLMNIKELIVSSFSDKNTTSQTFNLMKLMTFIDVTAVSKMLQKMLELRSIYSITEFQIPYLKNLRLFITELRHSQEAETLSTDQLDKYVEECSQIILTFLSFAEKNKLDFRCKQLLIDCLAELFQTKSDTIFENLFSNETGYLSFLKDYDTRVRMRAGEQIHVLYDLFQNHVEVFNDTAPCLSLFFSGKAEDMEQMLTSIATLGYIAISSTTIERPIIWTLFKIAGTLGLTTATEDSFLCQAVATTVKFISESIYRKQATNREEQPIEILMTNALHQEDLLTSPSEFKKDSLTGRFTRAHLPWIFDQWLGLGVKTTTFHKHSTTEAEGFCCNKTPLPLSRFPFHLAGYQCRETFLEEQKALIVPRLLSALEPTNLDYMSICLHTSIPSLVKETFPATFALLYPLYHIKGKETHAQRVFSKLEGYLKDSGSTLSHCLAHTFDDVMINLLTLCYPYNSPLPGSQQLDELPEGHEEQEEADPALAVWEEPFSAETVKVVLDTLSRSWKVSLPSLLYQSKSSSRFIRILMDLDQAVYSAVRKSEKTKKLRVLLFFVSLLEEKIQNPCAARPVLDTLLRYVDVPYLTQLCCKGIRSVLNYIIKTDSGIALFNQYVCLIVAMLVPLAEAQQGQINANNSPLALLSWIIKTVPGHVERMKKERAISEHTQSQFTQAMVSLPLLPKDKPLFTELSVLQNRMRGRLTLADELEIFVQQYVLPDTSQNQQEVCLQHLSSMPFRQLPTRVLVSVTEHLTNVLETFKDDIIPILDDPQKKSTLFNIAWFLVQTAAKGDNPPRLLAQIGKCLGFIGTIEAGIIPKYASKDSPVAGCQQNELSAVTVEKLQLVYLLENFLHEHNVNIAKKAAETLQSIFNKEEGKLIFSHLSPQSKTYLSPFTSDCTTDTRLHGAMTIDWEASKENYERWICSITSVLCSRTNDPVLSATGQLCRMNPDFASAVLPIAVYCITRTVLDDKSELITEIGTHFKEILEQPQVSKQTTNTVIRTLDTHRVLWQSSDGNSKQAKTMFWDSALWRHLSMLALAKAALRCGSVYMGLYYVERWCEMCDEDNTGPLRLPPASPDFTSANKLLVELFCNTNEPDNIYGVQQVDTQDSLFAALHEKNWNKAFALASSFMNSPTIPSFAIDSLCESFRWTGAFGTRQHFLRGLTDKMPELAPKLEECQYENAWRLCDWSLPDPKRSTQQSFEMEHGDEYRGAQVLGEAASLPSASPQNTFHRSVYSCLNELTKGQRIDADLLCTRVEVLRILSRGGQVQEDTLAAALPMLHQLNEIEEVRNAHYSTRGAGRLRELVTRRWQTGRDALVSGFHAFEQTLALRESLVRSIGKTDMLPELLVYNLSVARRAHAEMITTNKLNELKAMQGCSQAVLDEAVLEECKLKAACGNTLAAIGASTELAARLYERKDRRGVQLLSRCLRFLGNQLSRSKLDNSASIREKLEESVKAAQNSTGRDAARLVRKSHLALAQFCDGMFQTLDEKVKSPEWRAFLELSRQRKEQLEMWKGTTETAAVSQSDINRQVIVLRRTINMDEQECTKTELARTEALLAAVRSYLTILSLSTPSSDDTAAVFRLYSLWCANPGEVNLLVDNSAGTIPPSKFLPLWHQIVSRLSGAESKFQATLRRIIERTVLAHPNATLWQLFSLVNGDDSGGDHEKSVVAKGILQRLRTTPIKGVIADMERLIAGYFAIARLDVSQTDRQKGTLPLPPECATLGRGFGRVGVPTVEPDLEEKHMVTFAGFAPNFTLVGGINVPKCVKCVGSDGRYYKQLVKSKDDLRQDMVMEQVFQRLNAMLRESKEARRRELGIRTYKVVPLSPQCGILEWVQNTVPLGEYLIGTNAAGAGAGAHQRLRPGDRTHQQCRAEMKKPGTDREKLARFADICRHFKPVFHHFFLEHYERPQAWFQKKLAYTRSVAASSIVGYVLGLGDRHSQNILIDSRTAEVVHIDLGIAFEQGKILNTPELVPFRLTRDVVDGMGVCGVEGAFRRSCEITCRVLREKQQNIITILDVFIHDPLYKWSLEPAALLGGGDDDEQVKNFGRRRNGNNGEAERALIRVKEKLRGQEMGETLSVEGQVNKLIQEATDDTLLCKMFPGWGPWV